MSETRPAPDWPELPSGFRRQNIHRTTSSRHAFCEASPDQPSTGDLPGWHRASQEADEPNRQCLSKIVHSRQLFPKQHQTRGGNAKIAPRTGNHRLKFRFEDPVCCATTPSVAALPISVARATAAMRARSRAAAIFRSPWPSTAPGTTNPASRAVSTSPGRSLIPTAILLISIR